MRVQRNIGRLDVKAWITEEELDQVTLVNNHPKQELLAQAINCSNLPAAFHHFALMADAHSGFGMPIGGVLALKDAICPAAVGYDIGCGMIAVKLNNVKLNDIHDIRDDIAREISKRIPLGEGQFRSLSAAQKKTYVPVVEGTIKDLVFINDRVKKAFDSQLGTLGGGNHFIELDYDEDGYIWAVVHSGSRAVGHAIGGYYMNMAQDYCHRERIQAAPGLYYFDSQSNEGVSYRAAMDVALDWAYSNRSIMLYDVVDAVGKVIGRQVKAEYPINVHHNYASQENHFGTDVWVHRKGATRAEEGERLVIPGNMGQGTAICTGLGNPDSFCSSSHGAGRRLGRAQAKRELDYETEKTKLDALDVYLYTPNDDGALDEMPAAYKDFDDVLDAQSDVVNVDFRLTPTLVIKG